MSESGRGPLKKAVAGVGCTLQLLQLKTVSCGIYLPSWAHSPTLFNPNIPEPRPDLLLYYLSMAA